MYRWKSIPMYTDEWITFNGRNLVWLIICLNKIQKRNKNKLMRYRRKKNKKQPWSMLSCWKEWDVHREEKMCISQFKQLNVSTRDDHGHSERLQHTNVHTYTQGRFQVSSDIRAHHATYAEWLQLFEACVIEISICFHFGWHYRCSVTLVTQQAMRSFHENSSIVT